jgi:MraZ protein
LNFRGVYDHTIDSKNRLTLPRRLRSHLADGAVIAIPTDGEPCIWIARRAEYDEYVARALEGLSPLADDRLRLERFYGANSQEVELDTRERIMLPSRYVAYANLDRDIVIVGTGSRMECWDRERWAAAESTLKEETRAIAARASNVG